MRFLRPSGKSSDGDEVLYKRMVDVVNGWYNNDRVKGSVKFKEVVDVLKGELMSGKRAVGAVFPSVTLVSRRFGIAHLTAVKVLNELKRLGLIRSYQGKGTFVVGRRRAIGLIVPALPKVEIFAPICHEISTLCQDHDWLLYFFDEGSGDPKTIARRLRAQVQKLIEENVAGVIYHPVDFCADAGNINREVLALLRTAGLPVVLLDSDVESCGEDGGYDLVGIDNHEVGIALGRHVLEAKAKKILFVMRCEWAVNSRKRLEGVKGAVSGVRAAHVDMALLAESNERRFARALKRRMPDAIICSSDSVAAQVLKVLAAIGKQVPKDVIVVGINDVEIARVTSPALTTIHQPCAAIARAVFETIEWRIRNPSAEARRIYLPARLVVRASSRREK